MASQSDKKEEFRKYLEKGKVLHVLTTVLTDLFEMDSKPDDPLSYLHHRFGESLCSTTPPPNGPQKDLPMTDPTPAPHLDPVLPNQTSNHNSTPQNLTDQTPTQSISILQHKPLPTSTSTTANPAASSIPQVNTAATAQAPVHVNPTNPVVTQNSRAPTAQLPIAHAQPATTSDAAPVQQAQPPSQLASASQPSPSQVSQPLATDPAPVQ